MPARSVCLVALSLSEAGPGRLGGQVSVTDIYHTNHNGACLRHCPSEGQCLRAGAYNIMYKLFLHVFSRPEESCLKERFYNVAHFKKKTCHTLPYHTIHTNHKGVHSGSKPSTI